MLRPLRKNPVFVYFEDRFQKPAPFRPDISVGIDTVIDQKIRALDAHTSQFYEWLPWVDGDLDKVPADPAERLKWLTGRRTKTTSPAVRAALKKWYGDSESKIQFAESFEICEYGRQPKESEIRELFPMLKP